MILNQEIWTQSLPLKHRYSNLIIFIMLKKSLHKLVLWAESTLFKHFLLGIKGEDPFQMLFPHFSSQHYTDFLNNLHENIYPCVRKVSLGEEILILMPIEINSCSEQSYMNFKQKFGLVNFFMSVNFLKLEHSIIQLSFIATKNGSPTSRAFLAAQHFRSCFSFQVQDVR